MKKLFFSLTLALSLFLAVFSRPALANTPTCEWSERNGAITYCAGGFTSEAEGRRRSMYLRCQENCGQLLVGGIIGDLVEQVGSFIFARFGTEYSLSNSNFSTNSNGAYTCIEMAVVDDSVDNILRCIQVTNGTPESCMPVIGASTGIYGFTRDNYWCSSTNIPSDLLLPRVEAALRDVVGDPLLPTPTPGPLDTIVINDETFDTLNPLVIENSDQKDTFSTPGGIISRVLEFAFPIAGMILFVMLVLGGFSMVAGAGGGGGSKAMEEGKNKISAAIVGFILLFSSFWIIRLLEMIFSLKIL